MTDEPLFIPSPVYCQAVVDALGDDIYKVRVTPLDLTRYMPCTYTIRADSEDTAAKMSINRFVQTQEGIERLAVRGAPGAS